jgi:sensor c-di-GMP phosphodiesterase-like protein
VTTDRRSGAIVRSTVELAHAQGYHFSRPVPADAFTTWTRARTADAAPSLVP